MKKEEHKTINFALNSNSKTYINNTINEKNTIDISIVIVNYNVKDFLEQCLISIFKAKRNFSLEIFVVDNASTDGSVDYLSPIFTNVKFISSTENLGFSKANNIAIKQATGKYLLILNPDTILAEDTLEAMYNYMEQHPEVGISGCKVLNSDGTFQVACRRGFPTPWTSFCKLFGLQKLFPKSKLFARYNQTFRSENESYYIDAVIGAFMFCDTKLIQELGGFDEVYFMYGEDLDLCRSVQLAGRKVAYFSETSIIHFKGESTRRSSINEIKHFYESMRIFAKKHFAYSTLFLLFLQLGINSRLFIAKLGKYRSDIFLIVFDLLFINIALMLGTYIKFGSFLGFPDYAYPLVFIVTSAVYFLAQFFTGEYFEGNSSIGKTIYSLMICFFVLSSLTYFFPEYRFSRGALLVTIGVTTFLSSSLRLGIDIFHRTFGKYSDKRIIVAGCDEKVDEMIDEIRKSEPQNMNIVGIVNTGASNLINNNFQVLGHIENINSIVEKNDIDEVIITDTNLTFISIMKLIGKRDGNRKVRFHIIPEYNELITARIINEISGNEPTIQKLNITKPRLKITKRIIDIFGAIFMLTIGLIFTILQGKIKEWWQVLIGEKSIIGIEPIDNKTNEFCKPGIITLANTNNNINISNTAIESLNYYYIANYSLSLDIDILVRYITRKIRKQTNNFNKS